MTGQVRATKASGDDRYIPGDRMNSLFIELVSEMGLRIGRSGSRGGTLESLYTWLTVAGEEIQVGAIYRSGALFLTAHGLRRVGKEQLLHVYGVLNELNLQTALSRSMVANGAVITVAAATVDDTTPAERVKALYAGVLADMVETMTGVLATLPKEPAGKKKG